MQHTGSHRACIHPFPVIADVSLKCFSAPPLMRMRASALSRLLQSSQQVHQPVGPGASAVQAGAGAVEGGAAAAVAAGP